MSDSLYKRLGGYDAIVMFATKLVGQAQQDEVLARFWANRGQDRIDRELQLLIDYLVNPEVVPVVLPLDDFGWESMALV